MLKIDHVSLEKEARRSWVIEFSGMKSLHQDSPISLEALPFSVYKNHIETYKKQLEQLAFDDIRYKVVIQQLNETAISYIYRYRWIYSSNSRAPFSEKWIRTYYNSLLAEGYLL